VNRPIAESRARGVVLVVDDSPQMLEALCELLEEEHDTIIATSGAEALQLARTENPDLILLDVVMPDVDGYTVCARLKEDPSLREIPVIFLTGRSHGQDEARGLEQGAIDYISKPINPPVVRARVRNHMELKRSRDALKGLSFLDALTGVANRRSFDLTLETEWQRSMRSQRPLSLIMVDVDHFKLYNDHLGHRAGDECLRQIASALQAAVVRGVDLLARYGGEEFVAILPETPGEGARLVAARMQQEIAQLDMDHPASSAGPKVSASIGAATHVAQPGTNSVLLVEAADRAVYMAKHRGRNRSVCVEVGEVPARSAVSAMPAQPWSAPEELPAERGTESVVLLVEDDPRMAMLLRGRLGHLGARLCTVTNGEQAMTFVAGCLPDLILSDVVLPGIDGIELCKRLKANPTLAPTPFAVLTTLSRNLRVRSVQAGADDYISKLEGETVFKMRTRTLLELGLRRHARTAVLGEATVLVLSGDPAVREELRVQLAGSSGITVQAASSLAGGSVLFQSPRPAVLIIDLALQDEDPCGWIQEVQRRDWAKALAVVVVAGKAEESLLPQFLDVADDRLSKPLEAAETRHRVALMLRLARARGSQTQGTA